jgi:ApbE superfamily uncharacterized protein (UPF0280 family)
MGVRSHFEVEETAVTIITDEAKLPRARRAIFEAREEVKAQIRSDPLFATTLEPYGGSARSSLVQRMIHASSLAKVGPMASVAGAIAEAAVLAIDASHAIVDNGGDLALRLDREVNIGLHSNNARFKDIGMKVVPRDEVFGICTSSGKVGPSISFGLADSATVISANVPLADACATRLGNLIVDDDEGTVLAALEEIVSIEGVEGAVVIVGEHLAMRGSVPRIIRLPEDDSRITQLIHRY